MIGNSALAASLTCQRIHRNDAPVRLRASPVLSRLWAFGTMLCIALTLGMGMTAVQANASVLSHIACGDHQLPDGGWVCNCEPGEVGCIKHIPDNGADHGNDVVEMHHHHHAEAPSGTPALPMEASSPHQLGDARLAPPRTTVLLGIDPSQADQRPKA